MNKAGFGAQRWTHEEGAVLWHKCHTLSKASEADLADVHTINIDPSTMKLDDPATDSASLNGGQ
jgi:hypothetical protein